MQIDLFDIENLSLEQRVENIKQSAFNLMVNELKSNGFVYSCTSSARELAKKIRESGTLCKSKSKHIVVLLN